jgi:hypothetical protein
MRRRKTTAACASVREAEGSATRARERERAGENVKEIHAQEREETGN